MTHHLTPDQLTAMKQARNWFIALMAGLAFCYSTSNDQCMAELDKAAAYEAQQDSARSAAVEIKAKQIAAEMLSTHGQVARNDK